MSNENNTVAIKREQQIQLNEKVIKEVIAVFAKYNLTVGYAEELLQDIRRDIKNQIIVGF